MKSISVLIIVSALGYAGPAHCFCSEPSFSESAPDAPSSFDQPDVPYCLSTFSYSGKHSCDSWEIDSYKAEVEGYVEKLQEYANETAAFANSASNFASEAARFAKCEAEEAVSQHQ